MGNNEGREMPFSHDGAVEFEIIELDTRLDMAVDFVGLSDELNANCPSCNLGCVAGCNNNCGANCVPGCGS
jgi:hypothetical protein